MNLEQPYIERIRAAYPTLTIAHARIDDSGQNNLVLEVEDAADGALIFRFARYAEGIATLRREVTLLRGLRGKLPLATPDPGYVALESERPGEAFMGYRRIPGAPLWREELAAIGDEAAVRGVAAQVGRFLRALHEVSPAAVGLGDLPVSDTAAEWADLGVRFRDKLFAHMRPDARDEVAGNFEAFLGDGANFTYAPTLRHGDFGTSNVLWDAATHRLTGVIDFGSAGLGDPAVDLAGLICRAGYGEAFARRCLDVYPALEALLPRARFYASTFALQYALFGVEQGEPEAFEHGIAAYR
jgi:aminoglycoside 2''-phosphotransferase